MFRPLTLFNRGRSFPALRQDSAGDPFVRLHNEINRLFEETFSAFPATLSGFSSGGLTPSIDLRETDDAFEASVELPGVAEKDLDVQIADNVLSIRGEKRSERKEDGDEGYHFVERTYGSFARSIPLPADVDPDLIEGAFKDGVLRLSLPKLPEAKSRSRKVAIKRD